MVKPIETPQSWKDVRFEVNPTYSIRSLWNKSSLELHFDMVAELKKPKPYMAKVRKLDSFKEMFTIIRTKDLGERYPDDVSKQMKIDDAIRLANKMYSINNK